MWDQWSKPRVRSDLQYRELADGGVIYDTAREKIHTLNLAAAFIWNCCDGSHDLQAITSELRQQANLSLEQASRDVKTAIEYFDDEGLLRSP
jgi:hypothetical protein